MSQDVPRTSKRSLLRIVAIGAALCVAFLLMRALEGGSSDPSGTPSPGVTSGTTTSQLAPAAATTSMQSIAIDRLPPEARTTLRLISQGGPFPYDKDGATFGNFERLLPQAPRGFYREYTVETPGSYDRGARRIVAGGNGARFYTKDHYRSFREVIAP